MKSTSRVHALWIPCQTNCPPIMSQVIITGMSLLQKMLTFPADFFGVIFSLLPRCIHGCDIMQRTVGTSGIIWPISEPFPS